MTARPSIDETINYHEPLVAPAHYDSDLERQYWAEYEALVQAYYQQKSSPDSDEGQYGLYCLGSWPLTHAEWDDDWPSDWHFRFDAQTLELLHGGELLMQQILEGGLIQGSDEKAVVDEIEEFVAWLGRTDFLPETISLRLSDEIARVKPDYLKAVAEADLKEQEAEAYETEAGRFVGWLLTELDWPLDKLLLGQSLCIDALESLGSHSIQNAPWSTLDIVDCMHYTARQLPFLHLTLHDLRATAVEFIGWLSCQGLLERFDRRRLIRKTDRI